jgi:hypothetical protein
MNDARVQEIRSAAEEFREAIEQSDWNLVMDEYFILRNLRAMCKPAAMLVDKYLREELDCRPIEFVSAQRWTEAGLVYRSHFWLEHDGLIIDISADQYPEIEQSVMVTADHSWHDGFTNQSRFPYSDVVNDNTEPKFYATYAHILKTLSSGATRRDING